MVRLTVYHNHVHHPKLYLNPKIDTCQNYFYACTEFVKKVSSNNVSSLEVSTPPKVIALAISKLYL